MRFINNKGFTLVEAVVALMISSVLAGVLFTILRVNNDGVSRGSVNTKNQMQYETVVERVGYYTRIATAVLDDNSESWTAFFNNPNTFTAARTNSIAMYDADGTKIAGYTVDNTGTILREYISGSGIYKNFIVGPNNVTITGQGAANDQLFALTASRKCDTVLLSVYSSDKKATDTTLARYDVFTCKN